MTEYRLPEQPPVGTIVEFLDGPNKGERLTRIDRDGHSWEYCWLWERGSCWRWDEVLRWGAREVR